MQAREALNMAEGDVVSESVTDAERRLTSLPGVVSARINRVCCDDGKAIIYVGLEEKGAEILRFREAPRGTIRLPDDVVQAGNEFDAALERAVERGDAGEDHSNGHALMHDPAARAVEERFITFAARDLPRLREVLHDSADGEHRALAAEILGYASDKRDVIADLVAAMADPHEAVRNNAMRALWVIADVARRSPALRLRVPPEPFVDLLNSPTWSDRNKASLALMELSDRRDPALLAALRTRALPSLIEMARWKSRGHAAAAVVLLGRAAGVPEKTIQAALNRGAHQVVIDAALKRLGAR